MAKRTRKVGITGKYGTRYGASLRKQIKKMEVTQHARYTCTFCGKVRRIGRGAAGSDGTRTGLERHRGLGWMSRMLIGRLGVFCLRIGSIAVWIANMPPLGTGVFGREKIVTCKDLDTEFQRARRSRTTMLGSPCLTVDFRRGINIGRCQAYQRRHLGVQGVQEGARGRCLDRLVGVALDFSGLCQIADLYPVKIGRPLRRPSVQPSGVLGNWLRSKLFP